MNYSKLPSEKIPSHIKKIRDEAFKIHPCPCLAAFAFLDLMVTDSPHYATILQRLKSGETYLDLGCCVGQDIRKLVYDGAPSENTYGCDLESGFLDMGYDFFLDKTELKTTFIAARVAINQSGDQSGPNFRQIDPINQFNLSPVQILPQSGLGPFS
ncbi:hypothetical protein CC80DRAFT_487676 [Byssothecium circinans]|uniref:Methyltransferase domain-containing protein n=1 Tax=Byssothecium circinans TaxID=147558 RepID=A0A6A5UCV8_9PLEO|nr:hypothetical protein CC80DRAFT_487676 [Byssothecium circinans]